MKTSLDPVTRIITNFYPSVQVIYLFGSHGTDYENASSDVDLAILLPHGNAMKKNRYKQEDCTAALEAALEKPVDMVDLHRVDTVFQEQVVESGRVLFCRDDSARQCFEMLVLSGYLKLQEERRAIIDQIRASGRIVS